MQENVHDDITNYYKQWLGERAGTRVVVVSSPSNADSLQLHNNVLQQCVTAQWATFSMYEMSQFGMGANQNITYLINKIMLSAMRSAHVCVLVMQNMEGSAFIGAGVAIGSETPLIVIGNELAIEWCPSVLAFCKTTADLNMFLETYTDKYSNLLSKTSRLRATAAHFSQWRYKDEDEPHDA